MAVETPLLSNFSAGEFSSDVYGRPDVSKYHNGCRILRNFISKALGPAARRTGFRYVGEVASSAKFSRGIGFEHSAQATQAYMLEFADLAVRVWRDRAQVFVATTAAAIANGDFPSNITGWTDNSSGTGTISHDATNGRMNLNGAGAGNEAAAEQAVTTGTTGTEHVVGFDLVGDAGDLGVIRVGSSSGAADILADTELEAGAHRIAFTPTASPFYLQFLTTSISKTVQIDNVAMVSNAALEIPAPWTEAQLRAVQYVQSADVLYLFHPAHATRKLKRRGHASWSLVKLYFRDGPYLEENTDDNRTLTPSAATGTGITVTAAGFAPFAATDVGRLVRMNQGGTWGHVRITGFTDSQHVTADVIETLTSTAAKTAWRLGLFSDTTGWPKTGTFHNDRLKVGGSPERPAREDMSAVGDFELFAPGTDDADAVAINIAANKVPTIQWMSSGKKPITGTLGAGFRVGSDGTDAAVTPANVTATQETRFGAAELQPVEAGNAILYIQRHATRLRELVFSFEVDGFRAPDLTELARHMTRGGVVDMAYQQEPWSLAWCCCGDGRLIAMTYERDQDAVGWHEHPVGGDGFVEAVATIPGDGQDDVYIFVKRTIDGQTKRYIEVLEAPLGTDDHDETAFHVDSGLTLDNTVAATLTPGATTGTGVPFTAGASVFVVGDVGRIIRYRYFATDPESAIGAKKWFVAEAEITGYTSGTVVACTIRAAFPATDAIAAGAWRLSVTTVSGLDHLEGETVQILGDGAVQPDQTVSGGQISLTTPAGVVHVGLKFVSALSPMRLEAGSREGTSQGKPQRIDSVIVRFDRSSKVSRIGTEEGNLQRLRDRSDADPMDAATPLFTGDVRLPLRGKTSRAADILIVHDTPDPCTVVSMTPQVFTGDG